MSSFTLCALFSIALLSIVSAQPQVQLGGTTLIGKSVESPYNLEFFGGIPFAEPPLGSLRLQPPVPKLSLGASSFNAGDFGLACLQEDIESSEDCLTINILRPAGLPSNASLPVMAWIYGGGFVTGSSGGYDGSPIVGQSVSRGTPVIYVNFNYRLGPLGFPQGVEAASRGALNLGLKDQQTALQWIQQNIGAFGGDKSKVTVFGESAGSIAIGVLFLNPSFHELARAAIFESGSAGSTLTFGPAHREADWENFVRAVPECSSTIKSLNTFGCLQEANSTALLNAFSISMAKTNEFSPWVPTIDGPGGLLPDFPSRLFEKGEFAHLPFIAGTNLDEGTDFTPFTVDSSQAIHDSIIANYTPSLLGPKALAAAAENIMQLYPDIPALGSPFGTGDETFNLSSQYKRAAAISGDLLFEAQRRLWIQAASKVGVKTFGYVFTDRQPAVPPALGVPHSLELYYVYGLLASLNSTAPSVKLGGQIIDYWVSFATSLNPNDAHGIPRSHWAQYTPENQVLIQLSSEDLTLIPDDYRAKQINAINKVPVLFHH